jgi:signal transduction histidine kinase
MQGVTQESVMAAAAQECNDELTVIYMCTECLVATTACSDPRAPFVIQLTAAAERLAGLIDQMLNYSALKGARPAPYRMSDLID